jgi:hypothetical protein
MSSLADKEFRELVKQYLEFTVNGKGWSKAGTHEKICGFIAKELQIDDLDNWDLVRTYTAEALTNHLPREIGLPFRKIEEREWTVYVSKFIKKVEAILPEIKKLSYEQTGLVISKQDVWRIFRGENGIGVEPLGKPKIEPHVGLKKPGFSSK